MSSTRLQRLRDQIPGWATGSVFAISGGFSSVCGLALISVVADLVTAGREIEPPAPGYGSILIAALLLRSAALVWLGLFLRRRLGTAEGTGFIVGNLLFSTWDISSVWLVVILGWTLHL